ncbi:asparagine--tRNA ligase [Mycoplasmopsis synoviae]|uniref:Asparagine--tRNA ligase n=2 Tax=Mycoplasmopsis synoviae TaxID=2109 RepID=A0AAX3EZH4_MYCSY|nr:asparagine--tRNA ligase [Mycoplasmopsis synoviae]QGL44945.1 asparagine--tRNA ligase [Mycoplasmopsis synoviae]QXV99241.1 asparagine--tRNA ligase [Mycoplasmopsis synoviae]UBM43422.1 asparagine--tRNA ligase [Mycoplasmopsis synoviae]ULL02191.1 asparagine--tRNA ligase [Mycoplasmopsis synoviae]UZW63532.1 asparagine--tRNA ligase [Mycoplasmopsis synoviae]
MDIKDILLKPKSYDQSELTISGWVSYFRGNEKVCFVEINDGSTIKNLQVVFKGFDFKLLENLKPGSAAVIKGKILHTPGKSQEVEMQALELVDYKKADEDYPIQNKEIKLETLREIPHLRHRTKVLRAVMLIRSTLAQEIHKYFIDKNFYYMNSPIITSNDGEGAGETFEVYGSEIKHFFGKNNKATLGVTGQLHGESYAVGFKKIYTFAPTFRAENSNTKKHLAEFWMVEPEVAFANLYDMINLAQDLLKNVLEKTLEKNKFEFEFLSEFLNINLKERIELFTKSDLKIVDYRDAIKELEKHKDKFENKDIKFGLDLGTEHERYLVESIFKCPIALVNFPKAFKAFYMHQNDDGNTVAAFDLLIPQVGELIGGSQREVRYEKLKQRINELNISEKDFKWYLDLRRFGDMGSSGFGLGFERLVVYATGIENIRDSIPYPRTVDNIKM